MSGAAAPSPLASVRSRHRLDTTVDMAAATVAAALLLLVGMDSGGLARVLFALAFVSFVPGWALLGWGPFREGSTKVAVAVVLSLTICTALSLAQLWLRSWRPQAVFDLAAASCLVAILARLFRGQPEQTW